MDKIAYNLQFCNMLKGVSFFLSSSNLTDNPVIFIW